MAVMSLIRLAVFHWAEIAGNPLLGPDANMEGKVQRLVAILSADGAPSITSAPNSLVTAMRDRFIPLSGLLVLVVIQFGQVIFDGLGVEHAGMAWPEERRACTDAGRFRLLCEARQTTAVELIMLLPRYAIIMPLLASASASPSL